MRRGRMRLGPTTPLTRQSVTLADATTAEQDAALAALGIVDATCDPTISICQAPAAAVATLGSAVTTVTAGLLP